MDFKELYFTVVLYSTILCKTWIRYCTVFCSRNKKVRMRAQEYFDLILYYSLLLHMMLCMAVVIMIPQSSAKDFQCTVPFHRLAYYFIIYHGTIWPWNSTMLLIMAYYALHSIVATPPIYTATSSLFCKRREICAGSQQNIWMVN